MYSDLISIIVPVYNVSKYLHRCLSTLLEQTYTVLEIILIDDGSTDDSGSICDSFAQRDDRVIVIHKVNGGLYSARNAGIEIMTGKFCLFIDSDDYVDKTMVEQLYKLALLNAGALIVCGYNRVNDIDEILDTFSPEEKTYSINTEQDKYYFVLHYFINYNVPWEVWNKIYVVEIIKQYNISFKPNDQVFAEDILFNLEYLLNCELVIVKPIPLYQYMIRDESIMASSKHRLLVDEFCNIGSIYFEILSKCSYWYFIDHYCFLFAELMWNRFIYLEARKQVIELETISQRVFFEKYMKQLKRLCYCGKSPWNTQHTIQLLNMAEHSLEGKYRDKKLRNLFFRIVGRIRSHSRKCT